MSDHDLPSLAEWCADLHTRSGFRDRDDRICDISAPLAARLDMLHGLRPLAICRRDRLAAMTALEAIDALRVEVASLQAELTQLRAQGGGR